jgi:pilus assembly protein CpaC
VNDSVGKRRAQFWETVVVFLGCSVCLSLPLPAVPQNHLRLIQAPQAPQKVRLAVGKSMVIESPRAIKRVSVGDPQIADTLIISPRQIYLRGKAVGTTNLMVWGEKGQVSSVLDVEIFPDLSRLKKILREILPGENIQVTATQNGAITLFGEVSSTAHLSQAVAVAEAYAPKVTNLLQVAGVHQVMLEVRVAEMSRSLSRRLLSRGLGLSYATFVGDAAMKLALINNPTALSNLFPASAFFRFERGSLNLMGFIDALKEKGLVKILAEPTLVTLSGQEASFLAGGEFPFPVPQRENVVTIAFRSFGVALHFTPTVLSSGKISMKVAPEVSELNFSNATVISGFVVPALTVRRASTVIELADGQSFAIAGLLSDTVREVVSKFPLLGDIPILGALFRSSSFQKQETELIILVTPHLVKPLDLRKQPLPTDQFIEPNDVEFYLLGDLEGQGERAVTTGQLDGEFGYIYGSLGAKP